MPQQQVLDDQVAAPPAGGAARREEKHQQFEHATRIATLSVVRHAHGFAVPQPSSAPAARSTWWAGTRSSSLPIPLTPDALQPLTGVLYPLQRSVNVHHCVRR